jgi:hypothetical protein
MAAARRVPQRNLVPDAERRSVYYGNLGREEYSDERPTVHWTTAPPTSSTKSSKEEGPWLISLRQPQPSTQRRKLQLWISNRGQVTVNFVQSENV